MIELRALSRALSVCALSPAGSWRAGTAEQTDSVRKIRRSILLARLGRALPMQLLVRWAVARRLGLRDIASDGGRLSRAQTLESAQDLLGCVVADDVLTTDEEIAPLDSLPFPITLSVVGGGNRLLPPEINGTIARRLLPEAHFIVLPGVGHVPMIDDPETVAQTILRTTGTIGQHPKAG